LCGFLTLVCEQGNRRLGAYDLKYHFDIATRGVRIGTDFLMRLFRQSCEIRLRDGLVLDVQLDSEAKAAALARTDRYRTDHLRLGRVLLVLLGNVIERAAEAGRVARGEEMFRRRGAGLPGPPIACGTDRSALTIPSLDSVCPLRPPVAVAVAVKSGLILSMVDSPK
jgi:hypothetical protein